MTPHRRSEQLTVVRVQHVRIPVLRRPKRGVWSRRGVQKVKMGADVVAGLVAPGVNRGVGGQAVGLRVRAQCVVEVGVQVRAGGVRGYVAGFAGRFAFAPLGTAVLEPYLHSGLA